MIENKGLEETLVSMLTKASESMASGVDFLESEVPLVVAEILQWYMVYGIIKMVLGLALVGCIVIMLRWAVKRGVNTDESFVAALFAIVPAVIAIFAINLDWLKIYIAPKLWLIEYTATLVK